MIADFNINYLNNFLDKVLQEPKTAFLFSDFNVSLLNYNNHNLTDKGLDSLSSNSFIRYTLQPTRLTSHSKTLIDNMVSCTISFETVSDPLTAAMSDNLHQFKISKCALRSNKSFFLKKLIIFL